MIRKIVLTGFLLLEFSSGFCQKLFFDDFSLYNPAYTGVLDKNNITFSAAAEKYFDTDQDYRFSSGRLAVNIPVKKIYSGFGLHAKYSKFSIFSSLDMGIIYSFNYKFSKDFSVSAGSNFSLFKEKIKGEIFTINDDHFGFEPLYVNQNITIFNIDIGIWLKFKNLQIGLTNQHINKPSYEIVFGKDTNQYTLNNAYNGILNYNLTLGKNFKLRNSILIPHLDNFSTQKNFYISNLVEIKSTYLLGVTSHFYKYDTTIGDLSPIIGFNLNDTFEFLVSAELIRINAYKNNIRTIEGILALNF
jgi:type IX secretion system PorP/SprF family membrane protein